MKSLVLASKHVKYTLLIVKIMCLNLVKKQSNIKSALTAIKIFSNQQLFKNKVLKLAWPINKKKSLKLRQARKFIFIKHETKCIFAALNFNNFLKQFKVNIGVNNMQVNYTATVLFLYLAELIITNKISFKLINLTKFAHLVKPAIMILMLNVRQHFLFFKTVASFKKFATMLCLNLWSHDSNAIGYLFKTLLRRVKYKLNTKAFTLLTYCFYLLKDFFYICRITGLMLRVSGKISKGGTARSSRIFQTYGACPLSHKNKNYAFSAQNFTTKAGPFSMNLWLFF